MNLHKNEKYPGGSSKVGSGGPPGVCSIFSRTRSSQPGAAESVHSPSPTTHHSKQSIHTLTAACREHAMLTQSSAFIKLLPKLLYSKKRAVFLKVGEFAFFFHLWQKQNTCSSKKKKKKLGQFHNDETAILFWLSPLFALQLQNKHLMTDKIGLIHSLKEDITQQNNV